MSNADKQTTNKPATDEKLQECWEKVTDLATEVFVLKRSMATATRLSFGVGGVLGLTTGVLIGSWYAGKTKK